MRLQSSRYHEFCLTVDVEAVRYYLSFTFQWETLRPLFNTALHPEDRQAALVIARLKPRMLTLPANGSELTGILRRLKLARM